TIARRIWLLPRSSLMAVLQWLSALSLNQVSLFLLLLRLTSVVGSDEKRLFELHDSCSHIIPSTFVFCGVAGVQSQSITVDRQMRRHKVPRIAFVNKLDRLGATPWKAIDGMRKTLQQNAAAVQIPMGLESEFKGVIDIADMKAMFFEGHQ